MSKLSKKPNQHFRLAFIFLALFFAFAIFQMLARPEPEPAKISFSELLVASKLDTGSLDKIVEVTFQDKKIVGKRSDGSTVVSFGPYDSELRTELRESGVVVNFEPPEETSWWKELFVQSLPILLFLLIFIFFMRQLQVGGGKAMSFGKSRAKLMTDVGEKVTFKDVAGVEEVKEELEEIIEFLKDPKKFTTLGGKIPKGVLLIGPPGTGKTILARAVAGEAGVPFYTISGSDFVEMFVGVGASRVRDLFEQAKKNAPCIIFIDEIDAVGRHRGAGVGGGHDEREQTLNQLLVEMDGFEANEGVILVAATNRSDVLDPALLRPGRFDRRVIVGVPDQKGREAILKVHTRKTPLADDVDLKKIAQQTPGFSGADLANLVNESALLAARGNKKIIENSDFELAKDKVIMGPERKSLVLGQEEKKTTAYHEAGHAIVAHFTKAADPVHKVSIVPRGRALGVTMLLPKSDQFSLSKEQAEARIQYAMGGRAAEEIKFNHFSTGASDDIKKATEIARNMVCQWGMSESLGPVFFGQDEGDPFYGRQMGGSSRPMSDNVSEKIDDEVFGILKRAYDNSMEILNKNKPVLEELSKSLIVRESLEGKELHTLLDGGTVLAENEWEEYLEAIKNPKPEETQETAEVASNDTKEDAAEDSPTNSFGDPAVQGT